MELTYIKVFVDYLDAIEPLGDAERGRLFTALLTYARTGEAPQLGGNERFLFPMMRAQIDRDIASMDDLSKVRSESGKKGGRPKKQTKAEKPNAFFETKKSKDKDKEEDKDKEDNIPPLPPNGGLAVAADAGLGRVFACYEQTIGTPARHMVDEMQDYLQAMSPDVICLAIQEAANHGARNWAYITSILRRCRDTGIRSAADWEAEESARNKGVKQPDGKRSPVEEARLKLRQIAGGGFDDL